MVCDVTELAAIVVLKAAVSSVTWEEVSPVLVDDHATGEADERAGVEAVKLELLDVTSAAAK